MNKLNIKIILAIAVGILVGVVTGNLEKNKTVVYYLYTEGNGFEIPREKYDEFNKIGSLVNKKTSFNKEIGFYYGAVTGTSLIILFLIPSLMKKQDD